MSEAAQQYQLFGDRQDPLPGVFASGTHRARRPSVATDSPSQIPLMVPVHELSEWPLRPKPGPGQLSFGPIQMELSDAAPEAVQMSLIGDPQPWDQPSISQVRRPLRTPAKRRTKAEGDQLPLF